MQEAMPLHTQRTIGLILLGCVLAGLAVLAGLVLWLDPMRGVIAGVASAAIVMVVYVTLIGPWQRHWGASPDIARAPMPGDDLLRAEAPATTRAIEIDAPPERVFPWLRQIGFGRGGWYSYDWIDNDGEPSIERIEPDRWLDVGDRIEMMPGMGPVVVDLEPGHHVVSAEPTSSWCLLVEPTADGGSRLISRWKQDWPRTFATAVWIAVVDPGAFIMERKMLLRIRELAERMPAASTVGEPRRSPG
jgi:hypothetical protein